MFKQSLIAVLLCISTSLTGQVSASDLKGKNITLVLPGPAGSAVDKITRTLASTIAKQNDLQVVVMNKPGAAGSIGAAYVAKSNPDGLTLCMCDAGMAFLNDMLKLPGAVVPSDLEIVSAVTAGAFTLAVPGNSPFNSIQELVAYLKSNPEKSMFGSSGTTPTLAFKEFLDLIGAPSVEIIQYKGAAEVVPAIIRGDITAAFLAADQVMELYKDGRIKVLAVTNDKRLSSLPNIPSITEVYGPYTFKSFFGIYVPKNTPASTKQELNKVWNNALADPEVVKMFSDSGRLILGGDISNSQKIYKDQYTENRNRVMKYGDQLKN